MTTRGCTLRHEPTLFYIFWLEFMLHNTTVDTTLYQWYTWQILHAALRFQQLDIGFDQEVESTQE